MKRFESLEGVESLDPSHDDHISFQTRQLSSNQVAAHPGLRQPVDQWLNKAQTSMGPPLHLRQHQQMTSASSASVMPLQRVAPGGHAISYGGQLDPNFQPKRVDMRHQPPETFSDRHDLQELQAQQASILRKLREKMNRADDVVGEDDGQPPRVSHQQFGTHLNQAASLQQIGRPRNLELQQFHTAQSSAVKPEYSVLKAKSTITASPTSMQAASVLDGNSL